MGSEDVDARPRAAFLWTGRAVSALATAFLLFDGAIKLTDMAPVRDSFTRLGYSTDSAFGIGVLELACTALYALPRTSIAGAVLLTGFLGGATTTHLRVGDPFWFPILTGALVWSGLYLRDARLAALLAPRRRFAA
jgi:hypothetical protein